MWPQSLHSHLRVRSPDLLTNSPPMSSRNTAFSDSADDARLSSVSGTTTKGGPVLEWASDAGSSRMVVHEDSGVRISSPPVIQEERVLEIPPAYTPR